MPFWKKIDKGGKKKPPKPAVPRTAQQSIPMQRMFEDGTCRVKPNYYTRTVAYQDINYQLAQQEDKTAIFEEWCSFLNFFDSSIKFELSFVNMATDSSEFEKSIRIPYQKDGFDDVRAEYSQMLRQQLAKGNNGLTKTKFITFGVEGESMRQVKARLDHIQNDLLNNFHRLGVQAKPLNGAERLKLMHDMLSKRQYELSTGRRQKNDVIAYQIRQSFKPGEITAEEANKVGYELAMRFTKGKYAFIVATHTDREHIHNHIIYNSTALDSTRKFRDFLLSGLAVQRLSDLICLEHQLSVIEKKPYRERKKRTLYPPRESNRDRLCSVIDTILAEKPEGYEDFLQKLEQQGYLRLKLTQSSKAKFHRSPLKS